MNLNELAVQAKTDERAFERLLNNGVRWMIREKAKNYAWIDGYDEAYQMARLAVWEAVNSYDPGRESGFYNFAVRVITMRMVDYGRSCFRDKHKFIRRAEPLEWEDEFGEIVHHPEAFYELNFNAGVFRQECIQTIRDAGLTELEKVALQKWIDRESYECSKSLDNAIQRVKRKLRKNERLQQLYQEIG
ncbi:sigma factor [Effusibacillus dendaii]|uniref:RNA polymerase factor sigma-70 n=1 Tax=Effusibacillus dendaii TaxID=2743772 RepID=A0A7I8D8J5_9BACL|nr:sigma factor [Effusibacillus dendaii]BCJ86473.1 RNA polymerase factor sigma-70 [Effusibacillus dendaii]